MLYPWQNVYNLGGKNLKSKMFKLRYLIRKVNFRSITWFSLLWIHSKEKHTLYLFFNMCDNVMCTAPLYLLSMSGGFRWLCLLVFEYPIFLILDQWCIQNLEHWYKDLLFLIQKVLALEQDSVEACNIWSSHLAVV